MIGGGPSTALFPLPTTHTTYSGHITLAHVHVAAPLPPRATPTGAQFDSGESHRYTAKSAAKLVRLGYADSAAARRGSLRAAAATRRSSLRAARRETRRMSVERSARRAEGGAKQPGDGLGPAPRESD